MIGKTLSHYKILEKLGEGGMGVVYKAQDLKLDRFVALKFLPHHLLANEEDKVRFMHEAKAASALNHPNITTLYDIYEEEGEIFIAMECIEGESLKDLLGKGPLKEKKLLKIAIQMAEGLHAAHEAEIVHRDVKTENIMICKNDQVKILDFGLAKRKGMSKITKTGSTLGTLAYMSPEQVEGLDVDHRTDLWSFGVVLYEMATGKRPFEEKHDAAVMYSIVNEEPIPALTLNPNIPEELDRTIHKALEKEPENRYQHADDIKADLNRLKRDTDSGKTLVTKAHDSIPTRRGEKPIWRRPGFFLTTLAIVIVVILGFQLFLNKERGFPVSIPKEKSIAVMYFENHSGEAGLDKILVDLLTTNLSRYEEIDVVSSQRLFDILKLIGKQDEETIDRRVATEVAERAQVKTMLLGSIIKIGDNIRITTQLSDVSTGSNIGSEQVEGKKVEEIFGMVDLLTEKVVDRLGISKSEISDQPVKVTDVTTSSFEAYKYYQKGMENTWRWNFSEAERNFQQAVDIDSTFAMALLQLANIKGGFSLLNPLADLTEARELIKLAKKYSARATDKEQRYINMYEAFYNREFEISITLAEDLVRRYPKEKEGYTLLSLGGWFWGDYHKSIQALETALEIDPTYANAYNQLAYTLSFTKNHEKAISTVKKYLALQPDVYNTYDSAWEIYMMAGQYDEAYKICQEALSKDPEWYPFHRYMGYIHLFNEKGDLAREKFHQVIQIEPSRESFITRNVGYSYLYEGRYEEASKEFKRAIELAAEKQLTMSELRARFDLARCLMIQEDNNGTLDELASAITISPQIYTRTFNPILILAEYQTGIAMIKKGSYPEAQARAEKIKVIVEKDHYDTLYLEFYHLLLTELYQAQGKGEAALAEMEKISKWTIGHSPHARILLADIHAMMGDTEQAISIYEDLYNDIVSRSYPFGGDYFDYFYERSKIPYYLGRIYEQMGDIQQAIEYYSQVLKQWENADEDLTEIIDAKARIEQLGSTASL